MADTSDSPDGHPSRPSTAMRVASGGNDANATSSAMGTARSTGSGSGNTHRATSQQSAAMPPPPLPESSFLDAAPIDNTAHPDETVSEQAVQDHFRDVESSFLPTLSPVPTGPANGDSAADDTFLFDSPQKVDLPAHPKPSSDEADTTAVSQTTSNLENLDSSPTAAAAARTISRVVSMASNPTQIHDFEDDGFPGVGDESFASSVGNQNQWSQSQRSGVDAGGTPGFALRGKKPKYLRSRYASQRSSASSFATGSETYDENDVSSNHDIDFALQSGGTLPLGMPRAPSNFLPRAISIGSMASGVGTDDYGDISHQLEPLPEVDSPDRSARRSDPLKTPKPSRENLNSAPTDTVIAQHVKNVHVPESLAKEYKFRGGFETPFKPTSNHTGAGTVSRTGKSMTLKEQSSTIERLSKENFDLKLKVMFLSDRLDKLSEEGIKEMISENVELKMTLAVLQRDNKVLRKRAKELEKRVKDDEDRPSTARSGTSSADHTGRMTDEEAYEREQELIYLRERVEEYATEIENLRAESVGRESEKRKLADIVKSLGERTGENIERQEEADVWKDLLEQETAHREQADDDNRRLRDEVFQLKKEIAAMQSGQQHTTNIYHITKKQRDRNLSSNLSDAAPSVDVDNSNAGFSAASTLVDELRRESEKLRHENAELRREVGAQTSMLTSRNREKERLYQEIEELKISQRRGGVAASTADSILERSASRAGFHERSQSRGSGRTRQTSMEDEAEREELENRLAETRDRMSEIKLQNQELQRELEACMEDFEVAISGKRDAEDAVMSLQEELDNAMNDLVALQAERDDALRDQAEMENEFESLRREAQEEIDALESEADQRDSAIQRAQADMADRAENFEALQEEMRKMSESLVGLEDEQNNKLRRIQQLGQELDASNKELEDYEEKLVEANAKNQRLMIQQESSQGEIAFLREEQETDKIRIGDLEAAIAHSEQSLRDEKDRARELDERLQQERMQREMVASQEKEEVQQFVNELNREASTAKDEARRLRKSLSSREVEATEWKERLMELESNLREALGDLNGTRSSLLKSIAKLQRELENTVRELDGSKALLMEKDRVIKQRDALLESQALESRKTNEQLEKERAAHRNTKSQFDTHQKTHQHLSRTSTTQDARIAELEGTRGADKRKIAMLEQTARDQLQERNELLLALWKRLSGLCGREWANSHTLVDRQALPSVEVVASRLPGFSKNLMAAIKTIETMLGSFESRIKSVERDLTKEYQALENNLDTRSKRLDRVEAMVRNSVATGSMPSQEMKTRMTRLEEAYRKLKVENTTLRTASDVRARVAQSNESARSGSAGGGSPSPAVHRGPSERDRERVSSRSGYRDGRTNTVTSISTSGEAGLGLVEVGHGDSGQSVGSSNNDNRWLFRLRDLEQKLKVEREGRNQDRQAARQRLGGLESENKELRDRARRTAHTE